MRAIVTGCRGFVGGHVVRDLRNDAWFDHVVGLHRGKGYSLATDTSGRVYEEVGGIDLTRANLVGPVLGSLQPNYIFHFAANPNTKLSGDDPHGKRLFYNNTQSTLNLLSHAPEGCHFVFASSATVYGDGRSRWTESDRTWPTSVYGASKLACESLVHSFSKKLPTLILRFSAIVGPDARHGLLPDVVRKLLDDTVGLELFGDRPGAVKPYLHVEDAVEMTIKLGLHAATNLVNVAPDDSASVEEVAWRVMNVTKRFKNTVWKPEAVWRGDNPYVLVNNEWMKGFGYKLRYPTSLDAIGAATKQILAIKGVAV